MFERLFSLPRMRAGRSEVASASASKSLTGTYRLSARSVPAISVMTLGAVCVLTFAPEDMFPLRAVALSIIMFIFGILLAQHAPIWEEDE